MTDTRGNKGDRKEPPDDEAALSARLQRLGERPIASRGTGSHPENVTGSRQTTA